MAEPLTPEWFAELRELLAKATPSPWRWRWCSGQNAPELVHPGHGMLYVIDFVRSGMQGATARFATRDPIDRGGLMCNASEYMPDQSKRRSDYQTPTNADMRLVAEARNALPALLDAAERAAKLEAENERLREALKSYGRHRASCCHYAREVGRPLKCDCGYNAALAEGGAA